MTTPDADAMAIDAADDIFIFRGAQNAAYAYFGFHAGGERDDDYAHISA